MRGSHRFRVVAAAAAVVVGCGQADADRRAVDRAVEALRKRQEADGAWRSRDYADLKSGLPLTALVLFSFSRLPEPPEASAAIAFLVRHLDANGQVGAEYPNFTTGMALRAFRVYKPPQWEEMTRRMAAYLAAAQAAESSGWTRDDPGYGSWGLGGLPLRPRETLRLDISSARWALEALAEAGGVEGALRDKALAFVARHQNPDGGFCYSRAAPSTSKADGFSSYGSATADGVLALRALGGDAERLRAAEEWLDRHFLSDKTPGVGPPWDDGVFYYYAAAAAAAVAARDPARRRALAEEIRRRQFVDGLWRNPSAVMKEDDPLIATCFALLVLG
jgi:hypothetical protein